MFTRNWLFISDDVQRSLNNVTILNAGTGLGSVICELAVRTGFSNFIIADGDQVDISNLNRQAFRSSEVAKNKAEITATNMRNINPLVKVEAIRKYLNREDLVE